MCPKKLGTSPPLVSFEQRLEEFAAAKAKAGPPPETSHTPTPPPAKAMVPMPPNMCRDPWEFRPTARVRGDELKAAGWFDEARGGDPDMASFFEGDVGCDYMAHAFVTSMSTEWTAPDAHLCTRKFWAARHDSGTPFVKTMADSLAPLSVHCCGGKGKSRCRDYRAPPPPRPPPPITIAPPPSPLLNVTIPVDLALNNLCRDPTLFRSDAITPFHYGGGSCAQVVSYGLSRTGKKSFEEINCSESWVDEEEKQVENSRGGAAGGPNVVNKTQYLSTHANILSQFCCGGIGRDRCSQSEVDALEENMCHSSRKKPRRSMQELSAPAPKTTAVLPPSSPAPKTTAALPPPSSPAPKSTAVLPSPPSAHMDPDRRVAVDKEKPDEKVSCHVLSTVLML